MQKIVRRPPEVLLRTLQGPFIKSYWPKRLFNYALTDYNDIYYDVPREQLFCLEDKLKEDEILLQKDLNRVYKDNVKEWKAWKQPKTESSN